MSSSTMTNPLDVITFGEAMMMLVADRPGPLELAETFSKRTAGAETNVAIGLARLGLKVGWASRLGADSMARYLLGAMQAEGIDCSHVACDPAQRTGFLIKGRVSDGSDPPIEYHRKGSAASLIVPDDIDAAWLTSARHLHATGVFPALNANTYAAADRTLDLMRASGRTISFDPNLRPTLWPSRERMVEGINALAAKADWVLPGIEEGRLLTGQSTPADIAAWYLDRGAKAVVVKLGAEGAYFRNAEGEQGTVPGVPVPVVVDTVGAGDAFAVGVISAWLEGLSWHQALRRANWIASRALQVIGDMEGLPTRRELNEQNID
jgi:sugar/nucleoside kinase (ribokinase family)